MPKFRVRVKREQVSYADIEIDESTLERALTAIEDLEMIGDAVVADALPPHPHDWEVESLTLTVEDVQDEDGLSLADTPAALREALGEE